MPRLYFGTVNASIVLRNVECLDCTLMVASHGQGNADTLTLSFKELVVDGVFGAVFKAGCLMGFFTYLNIHLK